MLAASSKEHVHFLALSYKQLRFLLLVNCISFVVMHQGIHKRKNTYDHCFGCIYICVSTPIIPQNYLNKLTAGCDSLRCLKNMHHGKGVWWKKGRPSWYYLWRGVSNVTAEVPWAMEGLGKPD